MSKHLTENQILKIKLLRNKGNSYTEIKKLVNVGHGTVYRYASTVKISPENMHVWKNKQSTSTLREKLAIEKAKLNAKRDIPSVTNKEKLIFLTALYWGEGNKSDFIMNNSDPKMINVFVQGLRDLFDVKNDQLRANIRIFQDMDENTCKQYWSGVTKIPLSNFQHTEIIYGKKVGKLKYGMCRVRVKKATSYMLKYILALKDQVTEQFCSRSSTDRTKVS